jgi:hypothetical protein
MQLPVLLFLFLLCLAGGAEQQPLINLGLRCASTEHCQRMLKHELCHFRYVACLTGNCRALPALPCSLPETTKPCNDLNARCVTQRCRTQIDCDPRAHCQGQERCIEGHCVFETRDHHCRTLNETCLSETRLCSERPPATAAPTAKATTTTKKAATKVVTAKQDNIHAADEPTAAPTAAPTNVPLYGVVLLSVMLGVFLVSIIVAMLTRNTPLHIVHTNNPDGSVQYVY